MLNLSRKKYFYYLAIVLMANTFLLLLFNNLPEILQRHYIFDIIWVISLIMFVPNMFTEKLMIIVVTYGFFLLISLNSFYVSIDEWNRNFLIKEYIQISVGVSIYSYFHHTKDYIGYAKLTKWILIFLFITALMSILSSFIEPMYARDMIGLSSVMNESKKDAISLISRLGGGTYGIASVYMSILPLLFFYYKNANKGPYNRNKIVIYIIILIFALLSIQIFTNILLAFIFSVFAIFGSNRIKRSIIITFTLIILIYSIPKDFYVSTFSNISGLFERQRNLNYKFKDLAIFIDSDTYLEDNQTGAGARAKRYPSLVKTFIKSPVLGCYFQSNENVYGYKFENAHLYWMNKLTTTGIVGLLLYLLIPFYFIRKINRFVREDYKFYFYLALLSIIVYGVFKNVAGRETWYAFYIIIPGLYYLPLLKNENKTKVFSKKIKYNP